MRLRPVRNTGPRIFQRLNPDSGNLFVISEKVLDQVQRKIFHRFDRILARQRVHRVFDGVRRQNFLVLAFCVRRLKIAFEANPDRQFLDVVASLLPQDAQKSHPRLAIIVFAQLHRHASAPIRHITHVCGVNPPPAIPLIECKLCSHA